MIQIDEARLKGSVGLIGLAQLKIYAFTARQNLCHILSNITSLSLYRCPSFYLLGFRIQANWKLCTSWRKMFHTLKSFKNDLLNLILNQAIVISIFIWCLFFEVRLVHTFPGKCWHFEKCTPMPWIHQNVEVGRGILDKKNSEGI